MVNENIEIISGLKEKIDILVERYRNVKNDYDLLLAENEQLTLKNEQIAREKTELEEKYTTLKFSKALEASSGDVHTAKIRINQIVREIDRCIALLNR